ncbi:MAG: hypothetical protein HC772_16595 [Leptolyngbyaceae cyanobacterium CRU_2_3]|nr:hypothetical protein [Leptolyngbyaceae cyanobacterium CRU_2_3]
MQGGANTNAPATIATGEAAKQGSAETTQKASDKQGEDATTKDPITRIKELIDLQLAAAQVIQVKFSQAAYETELIKKNLSGITPQATASPPKIPGLKTGGETSPVQWVGEAGKELLVSPPRGSYVLNHRDAMSISGRALSPPKLAPIGSVSLPAIPTTMPKLDLPVLPGGECCDDCQATQDRASAYSN